MAPISIKTKTIKSIELTDMVIPLSNKLLKDYAHTFKLLRMICVMQWSISGQLVVKISGQN